MPANSRPGAVGIVGDGADVRQLVPRQIATDALPGLAEVGGLIDEWIAVVEKMQIDADIRGRSRSLKAQCW